MRYKLFLSVCFLTFIFALNVSCGSSGGATHNTVNETEESGNFYLHEKSGVKISWDSDAKVFPTKWLNEPKSFSATSITEGEVDYSIDIIISGLNKYPESILKKTIKQVYILKSLTAHNLNIGGTYALSTFFDDYKSAVYLINTGTSIKVERLFHHELSSLFLYKYYNLMEKEDWFSTNPTDFSYGTGGINAILSGKASLTFDLSYIEKGFLNEYSTSDFENDFNEISKYLFAGNYNFWFYIDQFENLGQKTKIAINFYNSIDPIFTEEYFRSLSEDE